MMNSTRDRWAAIFDDFRSSGLPVRDFCERRGVSTTAFYLRRRQLAPPAFVEARIVDDATADIVVELASREVVRVPRGVNEDALVVVLRAIARSNAEVRA